MKIGKYNIRWQTPKILYDKHIRKLWDPRLREHSVWNKRFLVLTNNYCNLECYSCSALCNLPFGSNPFRFEPYTTPISDIEKFLDLIDGYRTEYWIRLSGGETTLCGPDYIEEVCEVVHQHGRNISMLTNGARMIECDPDWFEFIHLDQHILNEQTIKDCRSYFKEKDFNRYQVWVTKEHRDLGLQRTDHITDGLKCEAMMEAVTLWRETVYPCCVIPFLDGWNNSENIRASQTLGGWTIHNPDLVDLLKSQECMVNRLLPDVTHACQTQCWKEGPNIKLRPVS